MKYYLMSVIVRDDGISDSGTEEYLSRETLVETLEIGPHAAGVDSRVVSVMECAGDSVSIYKSQSEDKILVDLVRKLGSSIHYGLSCHEVKLNEVFK